MPICFWFSFYPTCFAVMYHKVLYPKPSIFKINVPNKFWRLYTFHWLPVVYSCQCLLLYPTIDLLHKKMGGVKVKEETAEILRLAKEPSLQSFGVVIGLLQLCTCTLYSLYCSCVKFGFGFFFLFVSFWNKLYIEKS